MKYTFEILGISPILDFFNHQQKIKEKTTSAGVAYLGTHQCTLDAFLESVETVPAQYGWERDRVVATVIRFWMNHAERIRYWKARLNDADRENLLVSRVAELTSLKAEFESLLDNK